MKEVSGVRSSCASASPGAEKSQPGRRGLPCISPPVVKVGRIQADAGRSNSLFLLQLGSSERKENGSYASHSSGEGLKRAQKSEGFGFSLPREKGENFLPVVLLQKALAGVVDWVS